MKKVVLLGGTFDPIHDGHVHILKEAMNDIDAEEGWFILAGQSPLKDSEQLSFEIRSQFVQWMIEDEPQLKLCTIENDLPKPNYTINTLKELKALYSEVQFSYLIGSDQAQQFNKWFNYQEILNIVDVLVYPREGYEYQKLDGMIEVAATEYPVSSTEIRQMVSFKTHPKILNEIALKGYYALDKLKYHQNDKLMNHSLRVAQLSKTLAKHHGLDQELAYAIGIAHDLCKQWDDQEMLKYLNESEREFPQPVWHGFVSAKWFAKKMKVKDNRFYNAIYSHTLGDNVQPYSQIIYIADKCEPARKGKRNQEILDLSILDLNAGFKLCKEESDKYRERKTNESN